MLGIVRAVLQLLDAYISRRGNFDIPGNGIIAGLVVFFIAWVLREGQALKEEQELTV